MQSIYRLCAEKYYMIKKAIIPVAGFGTRFLPATKSQPKEMLSIIDKPVVQFLVEEAVASGIKEVILVTRPGVSLIRQHFGPKVQLEKHLNNQGKGHLVHKLRKYKKQKKNRSLRKIFLIN